MSPRSVSHGSFLVGKYFVDLTARQVRCGDDQFDLQWRQFEALRLLVEADGEPVDRDKLIETLWPGVTVEESSLNQCISQLRKSLRDTEASLIQTVPRRGYRLSVRPRLLSAEPEPVAAAADTHSVSVPPARQSGKFWIYALAAIVLVSVGGWFVAHRVMHQREVDRLVHDGLRMVRQAQYQQINAGNALLRQAMEMAPKQAIVYAALAEGIARSAQDYPGHAKQMAVKALELDPECTDCQAIAGWILMTREWEHTKALRLLAEAAKKKPEDYRLRVWLSQALAATGNLTEALREADAAIALQPGQPPAAVMRAAILYLSENYGEALKAARHALAMQSNVSSGWVWLYRVYGQKGEYEPALSALSAGRRSYNGTSPDTEYEQARRWQERYRKGGIAAFVRAQLEEEASQPIKGMMRYEHATWRMWAGDPTGAMDELEGLLEVRPFDSMYVAVDPAFKALRSDPRFTKLLARMGLGVPSSATLR